MRSTTRGASFTDFPRNTRQQHLRHCANVHAQTERAYEEHVPAQVRLERLMREAGIVTHGPFKGARS